MIFPSLNVELAASAIHNTGVCGYDCCCCYRTSTRAEDLATNEKMPYYNVSLISSYDQHDTVITAAILQRPSIGECKIIVDC